MHNELHTTANWLRRHALFIEIGTTVCAISSGVAYGVVHSEHHSRASVALSVDHMPRHHTGTTAVASPHPTFTNPSLHDAAPSHTQSIDDREITLNGARPSANELGQQPADTLGEVPSPLLELGSVFAVGGLALTYRYYRQRRTQELVE